jgi:hypothetical protein
MSKFNVGDKVKIPKTKKGYNDYSYDSFYDEINDKGYSNLVIDKIQSDGSIRLKGPNNGYLGMDVFYESDLELYEERYKASELKNGRIVILCQNQEEFSKAQTLCNRDDLKTNNFPVEFYPWNNDGDFTDGDGTHMLKWNDIPRSYNMPTPTHCINFSQIDFETETKTNNNMKLKRFKLVKTEYGKAYLALTGLSKIGDFDLGSNTYNILQKAGVLDLWFEEVPDTIKIHGYEVKKTNNGFKIGCKAVTFQQLQNFRDFMEMNGFSDISFGEYKVTMKEISQILAL